MKALVTGGISGLGRAVASVLAEEGYEVVVTYRRERGKGDPSLPAGGPGRIRAVRCDAGDRAQVEAFLDRECDFDVWVHAAGPFRVSKIAAGDMDAEEWNGLVEGNLLGVQWHARRIIPHMRQRRWGRIITFGYPQVEGAVPWEGRAAYASAKAGLLTLTRTLAAEEARHGITVNMICPGDIRPPYKEGTIAEARRASDPSTPIGRPGTGEDVARVVRFLCHPDSDMVTGSVIYVTGGVQYFPFVY